MPLPGPARDTVVHKGWSHFPKKGHMFPPPPSAVVARILALDIWNGRERDMCLTQAEAPTTHMGFVRPSFSSFAAVDTCVPAAPPPPQVLEWLMSKALARPGWAGRVRENQTGW